MWFFNALLVALCSVAYGFEDLNVNWFYTYEKQAASSSIRPCDNFYRHVCPRDVNKEMVISESARNVVKAWLSANRTQILEEDHTKTLTLLSMVQLQYGSRMKFKPVQELLDFAGQLIDTVAIYRGALRYASTFVRIKQFLADIPAKLKATPIHAAIIDDDVRSYEEMLSKIVSNFQQLDKTYSSITVDNYQKKVALLPDVIRKVVGPVHAEATYVQRTIIKEALEWGAINDEGHVVVFPSTFVPALTSENPAHMYASLGYILSHEIMHTESLKAELVKSFPAECVKNASQAMCARFQEAPCESGEDTFDEDFADIFGLYTALEMYKRVTEQPDITSFFTAYATVWCNWFFDAQQELGDIHSAAYVRTNNPLSLIEDFRLVYNCNPESNMMQRMCPNQQPGLSF